MIDISKYHEVIRMSSKKVEMRILWLKIDIQHHIACQNSITSQYNSFNIKQLTSSDYMTEMECTPWWRPNLTHLVLASRSKEKQLLGRREISLSDALSDCSLQIPTLDRRLISLACPEVVSPYYEKLIPGEWGLVFIMECIPFLSCNH